MTYENLERSLERIERKLDALLKVAGLSEHVILTDHDSGMSVSGTAEQVAGVGSELTRTARGDQPQFNAGEIIDI